MIYKSILSLLTINPAREKVRAECEHLESIDAAMRINPASKGDKMNPRIQTADRRQNPRYKVQGMVIAVARPPSLPPGPIQEISQNGLVFQYRQNGNKWMMSQTLDIIWADYVATHHLEKIPVRIVSDMLNEPQGKFNESATRRQAVAFENLTPLQENQLGRLIDARGAIAL